MSVDVESFITSYLQELRNDGAAVFVGAGLSKSAGYVDWVELLQPVANELGLDARREHDLVSLAQYHLNKAQNRQRLTQLLVDEFADMKIPTENHRLLARLPVHTYWTTNYDRLMENALEEGGRRIDVKYDVQQLTVSRRGRDAVLYKMHGDVEHPHKAVLAKDEYEKFFETHAPFITALSGDLVSKTFLFLGFSFADPNLDYILSRVRVRFDGNQRTHYCIVRRRSKLTNETDDDFAYATRKQDYMVQDLKRFNIQTVLINSFDEITTILKSLEERIRRKTVLISGSAVEFGAWGQQATDQFLMKLSGALIDRGIRINTGFGLGVGGPIVAGAVQSIYSTNTRTVADQLFLRPFPIGIDDESRRKEVFARYREELVRQAGTAIFVLGNKDVEGKIVEADGVKAEFDQARQNNVRCVAIGGSGYMAKRLADHVLASFSDFFPSDDGQIFDLYQKLGEPTDDPLRLLDPLLKMIDLLTRE